MKSTTYITNIQNVFQTLKNDFFKKLYVFSEVDSTNNAAKKIIETGFDEATLVVAETQKKGRGRFSRTWESPKGGLYCSIILKPSVPDDKITLLPLVTSLAVAMTVKKYNLNPKIKWPNDVRIKNRKIAGILFESLHDPNDNLCVISGIGINLNTDMKYFPKQLTEHITSIKNELNRTINYQDFFKNLLMNFQMYYNFFSTANFKKIVDEWKQYSDTLGKKVKIETMNGEIVGLAVDIDDSGFLLVCKKNNQILKITAGDCIYLR